MCYYNTIYTKKAKKVVIAKETITIPPSDLIVQSGFSHPSWPILINDNNKIILLNAQWGFLPAQLHNQKDIEQFRQQFNTLNAKWETAKDSALYKDSMHSNFCIVPSSGFIEWQHMPLPNKKQTDKIPYYIHPAKEDELFWMCGLYNLHKHPVTNETDYSFTIFTTTANLLMEQIHNTQKRMPCIIQENVLELWLTNQKQYSSEIAIAEKDMSAYTIAKDFMKSGTPLLKTDYQQVQQGSLF